jgi:hypothetical protein
MPERQSNPHFLVLHKYHLSRDKAREAVIALLKRFEVVCPNEGWEALTLHFNGEKAPLQIRFGEMVDEARRTGVVKRLQRELDKGDSVFGGTLEDFCTPNHELKCSTEYAGWKREAYGPCRSSCVERDLTDDILDYRRQACERSNEYDFRLTARHFREYLSACVSLIDAFINRHILRAQYDGYSSPEFENLKKATNAEEKVRLWWEVCSDHDSSLFFKSKAWCHFQEIRTKRNEILHAVGPISVYALTELQLFFNRVQTGVGELLFLLREAHEKPTLGFIERLRTAPPVIFHRITFREDGNHKIKVTSG